MTVSMDVRTIVRKADVPRGTLGKVVGFTKDGRGAFVDVGHGQQVIFAESEVEFLNELQPVLGSHGEVERTRIAQGIEYARTGLPEEGLQLRYHIRDLIDSGWSPMFMERHLVSDMGFNLNLFRNMFAKLAGLEFEDAVNFPYLLSPGTIPAMNLGWGMAKDGKSFIFIMPGTTDYMCLRQVDDQNRHELHRHKTLKEAVDCAKKLTKKLVRWDPPVKENKDLDMDPTQMYRQPQLFRQAMQGNSIAQELFDHLEQTASLTQRKELIDVTYLSASINKATRDQFLIVFCDDLKEDAKREVEQEAVADAMKSPDVPEVGDDTGMPVEMPTDVAKVISNYVMAKNESLSDFEIRVRKYTYNVLGPAPKEVDQLSESIAAATAVVKLGLDVIDKSAPDNPKHAMMVFTVMGDTIKDSNDSIKDIETQKIYGLSDEGLSSYFAKERGGMPELAGR